MGPTVASALRVENVSKRFGGVTALAGVDLDLRQDEILAVVGENGAGKSTMIKILAGALSADSGTVYLYGRPQVHTSPAAVRKAGVAVIYQDLHLVPQLSVAANIFLHDLPARRIGRVPFLRHGALISRARALLDELEFDIDPAASVAVLGRAQCQQVEIAKALAERAKIFIMDEPTASLESREVQKLFSIIRKLRSQGTSVIFVSHRLDEVLEIADRVTVFRDGRVVGTRDRRHLDPDQLVRMIVGQQEERTVDNRGWEQGELLLEAEGVTGRGVTKPVSLQVRQGDLTAVTGLIGSGYSDLLTLLVGHQRTATGEVRVRGGKQVCCIGDAFRGGVGYVPEDRKQEGLVPMLSIEDNIVLASLGKVSRWGFVSRSRCRALVDPLMKSLHIRAPSRRTIVQEISGGNQQKVVIARWLAADVDVIGMIEPTHGIDVGAKAEVHDLMRGFAADHGAVVFSSSELPEVLSLSHRLLAFRRGAAVIDTEAGKTSLPEITDCIFGGESMAEAGNASARERRCD